MLRDFQVQAAANNGFVLTAEDEFYAFTCARDLIEWLGDALECKPAENDSPISLPLAEMLIKNRVAPKEGAERDEPDKPVEPEWVYFGPVPAKDEQPGDDPDEQKKPERAEQAEPEPGEEPEAARAVAKGVSKAADLLFDLITREGGNAAWVRLTYASIGTRLGFDTVRTREAIKELLAEGRIQTHRLMRGPEKGNWFAIAPAFGGEAGDPPSEPERAVSAAPPPVAPRAEPRNAPRQATPPPMRPLASPPSPEASERACDEMMSSLLALGERLKARSFEIARDKLAARTGMPPAIVASALDKLRADALLEFKVSKLGYIITLPKEDE